ncbi:anoctamin-1-like [Ischnura elegans]|uniref:anoctamin-1-like n=1 Tax=Ischnura elegans TaxID=197161 RepID=UPI001ED8AC18|nr:anoctamin-1-like [Ischnura elegans]
MDSASSLLGRVVERIDPLNLIQHVEEGVTEADDNKPKQIQRCDFVLTFPRDNEDLKRIKFERELEKEGLVLHRPESSKEEGYPRFLLIHIPFEKMEEYAEKLEISKPLKGSALENCTDPKKRQAANLSLSPYHRQRSMFFDILPAPNNEDFFSSSERAQAIWHIMRRASYGSKEEEIGINKLLAEGAYSDAYHLHDNFCKNEGGIEEKFSKNEGKDGKPNSLGDWARLRNFRHNQPLDEIRDYFGEEVALYFAWLGTYTESLMLPALVGICCFIYGLLRMNSPDKVPMDDVCTGEIGKQMMCALCPSCSEEKLNSSCGARMLLLLFDNNATVLMAIFTSFWAAGFLIYWQRTQTRLTLRWGGEAMLSAGGGDRDTWEKRPEYKPPKKKNSDNKSDDFPLWERVMKTMASLTVVFFMAAVVVCALLGIIVYSISLRSSLYFSENEYIRNNSKTLTSFITAVINLVIIIVLDLVYYRVADWLTNMENPVTQADYDRSYVLKVYVFEFFNCYSSLFYIAFMKGHLYTYPGDSAMPLLAQDTCDSGSCMAELLIQLLVIMGGKQLLNLFEEIIIPRTKRWIKSHKIVLGGGGDTTQTVKVKQRWEKDFHLSPENPKIFCKEILEIVIQYGFVTMFVAAFPLAPLFAVINNIAEIRVDADKLLRQYRRALPRRIKKLASWDSIQHAVTYLAVAVNGCIIAFTSEFIPRLMYISTISEDHSLTGFVNFTLSEYQKPGISESEGDGSGICRYRGFREPPWSENPYSFSPHYWHIRAMQLLFVIVFEHVVLGLSSFIAYFIPEVPRTVQEKAHEERKIEKDQLAEVMSEGVTSKEVVCEEAHGSLETDKKGNGLKIKGLEVNLGPDGVTVSYKKSK